MTRFIHSGVLGGLSWFLVLYSSLALGLAFTGTYSTGTGALALIISSGAAVRCWLRSDEHEKGGLWLIFLLVFAAGAVVFLQPGSSLAGNWDPGVYHAQASALRASGCFFFEDSASPVLSQEEKSDSYARRGSHRVKMPGFFVDEVRPHRLKPEFYPLYPVWIAAFQTMGGIKGGLYASGTFCLISLLFLTGICLEVTRNEAVPSRMVAALATGFIFLLNPVQIWFSGFPTAEILMQTLFLGGAWSLAVFHRRAAPAYAFLAGMFFGLSAFASVTGIMLALSALLLFSVLFFRKKGWWGFYLPFLVLVPLSIYQNTVISDAYLERVLLFRHSLVSIYVTKWPLLLTAAVGAAAAWGLFRKWSRLFRPVCIVLTLIALLFAGGYLYRWGPDHTQGMHLAAMVSKAGLLIAVAGAGIWLIRAERFGWFIILVALSFTMLFMRSRMMSLNYPWAYKRFLAVTLPVVCLLNGFFWGWLAGKTRRTGWWVFLLLLPALVPAGRTLYRGRDFAWERDWKRLPAVLENVAGVLPGQAVVIADKWIATPLEFHYGLRIVPLYPARNESTWPGHYAGLVERLLGNGVPVFFVLQEERLDEVPFGFDLVFFERLETDVLRQSRKPFHNVTDRKKINLVIGQANGSY